MTGIKADVCRTFGKRCPRAADHRNECTTELAK